MHYSICLANPLVHGDNSVNEALQSALFFYFSKLTGIPCNSLTGLVPVLLNSFSAEELWTLIVDEMIRILRETLFDLETPS